MAVCPVDCFYEGLNSLAINPDECIDCGACEPECPTTAIFEEGDLPDKWSMWIDINAVVSGAKTADDANKDGWPEQLVKACDSGSFEVWPNITEQREAMPGADEMASVENKIGDLDPRGGQG
ncbi:MAG TPA: ferredoxin family protein [Kofleriaceae bacterium]|nr:ferredoxin family protein [Kofleriaceae bacterium]